MRISRLLAAFCILAFAFVVSASAQKRKPAPKPKPTPTPSRPYINPVISVAKSQVETQLYNVNLFVDKMGPVAVAFENADKDAAAGKLKKETADSIEANKKKMIAAIRGLRDPIVALETDFRTKAPLSPYLSTIQGVSTLCAQAEDSAIAGQWVASKDPLRQVAQKLNDTLAVLPGGVAGGVTTSTSPQSRNVPVSATSQNGAAPTAAKPTSSSKKDPAIGMTPEEVLQTSWGIPSAKRSSTSTNGTTEVWMYPAGKTIYFFKGRVSNIDK